MHLAVPAEPGLRKSVYEQNRAALAMTSLNDVELDSAAAGDTCMGEAVVG